MRCGLSSPEYSFNCSCNYFCRLFGYYIALTRTHKKTFSVFKHLAQRRRKLVLRVRSGHSCLLKCFPYKSRGIHHSRNAYRDHRNAESCSRQRLPFVSHARTGCYSRVRELNRPSQPFARTRRKRVHSHYKIGGSRFYRAAKQLGALYPGLSENSGSHYRDRRATERTVDPGFQLTQRWLAQPYNGILAAWLKDRRNFRHLQICSTVTNTAGYVSLPCVKGGGTAKP